MFGQEINININFNAIQLPQQKNSGGREDIEGRVKANRIQVFGVY